MGNMKIIYKDLVTLNSLHSDEEMKVMIAEVSVWFNVGYREASRCQPQWKKEVEIMNNVRVMELAHPFLVMSFAPE